MKRQQPALLPLELPAPGLETELQISGHSTSFCCYSAYMHVICILAGPVFKKERSHNSFCTIANIVTQIAQLWENKWE